MVGRGVKVEVPVHPDGVWLRVGVGVWVRVQVGVLVRVQVMVPVTGPEVTVKVEVTVGVLV